MKTQRRRGFTVVELVVVIAIIAVLAAVLIPTFTSIIKKANDSAYLQERQSKQIEDLAEKVDKMNYLSWEDFEKKLAEELAKIGKAPSTEEIENAVAEAIKQYHGEQAGDNTGLTEDQVKKIIEEAMKGQLTTAQVEAIVNAAVSKNPTTSGLTEAQVKQIVNSAIAKIPTQTGISKTEMQNAIAAAIAEAGTGLTEKQVKAIVEKALAGFSTLTAEEVEAIVQAAIAASTPSTDTIYIAGNMTLAADTTYILRTMNAINSVTLTVPNNVTVKEIIIDAPNINTVEIVYENGASALKAVQSLKVISTASTSTHVNVKVENMVVNSGRAVIEEGATVKTLKAAPSTNADVTVELSTGSSVTNPIVAEYQDHGANTGDTITIIDNTKTANVKLAASNELEQSGTTTTNVVVKDVSASKITVDNSVKDSEKITSSTMTLDVETTGETSTSTSYFVDPESTNVAQDIVAIVVVKTFEELTTAINNEAPYIMLGNNITANAFTNLTYSVTIDGDGYTISGTGGIRTGSSYNIFAVNQGVSNNPVDITFKNVNIINTRTSGVARVLDTRAGGMNSVSIINSNFECKGKSNDANPLCVGGSSSVKTTINITNSTLKTTTTGYACIVWVPADINVTSSELLGYADFYFKPGSSNSKLIVNDSFLNAPGVHNGSSDSFGAIVFETGNIKVDLIDSCIDVTGDGQALQTAILFSSGWANYYGDSVENVPVKVMGKSEINGEINNVTANESDTNNIYITGGKYTFDPTDYVDTTAYKVTESNGVWTVTAK